VGRPVVHFEIIGRDPVRLREYYGGLFGWSFDTGHDATEAVSEPGGYGFVDEAANGGGINGGVGGGGRSEPHVVFYVDVPNVAAALEAAVTRGGTWRMGPAQAPSGLVVGHFTDPEGNLVGLAGPE